MRKEKTLLICALVLSGALVFFAVPARAEDVAVVLSPAEQLQSQFTGVAKKVGPAVVSISTEVVQRVPVRQYPFGESVEGGNTDELFDQFLRDFFGEAPSREFKQRGLGTGVIINSNGYVLTNEHVVHGATSMTVTLPDGRKFEGTLKAADFRSDLAVIKIDAKELPSVELGDSSRVQSGQWAIAVGNPFGFAVGGTEPSITVGVVSAVHRSIRIGGPDRDYSDLIQTDAAINPGNSGGPLVDLNGKVIGINVAIFSTTGGYQGIGFAIPSDTVKSVIENLIEGRAVSYGWMGLNVQEITADLQQHFGLQSDAGVIIAQVMPGSPARKAGLQDGDVIISWNDEPIRNVPDLLTRVSKARVGQNIELKIIREGRTIDVTAEVGPRPLQQEMPSPKGGVIWRGLRVTALTPELARQYQWGPQQLGGVVVIDVEENSPAQRAGLQVGDLILELDRQPVASVEEFQKLTGKGKGDLLVKTSRGFFVLRE